MLILKTQIQIASRKDIIKNKNSLIRINGLEFRLIFAICKTHLEDVLVFSIIAKCVFAPAGRPAPLSGEVRERVRQAGWANVWVPRKVNGLVHSEYGQIVVQRTRVELTVYDHVDHVCFYVRVEFHVVIYVPFAQTYAQVLFLVPVCTEKMNKN